MRPYNPLEVSRPAQRRSRPHHTRYAVGLFDLIMNETLNCAVPEAHPPLGLVQLGLGYTQLVLSMCRQCLPPSKCLWIAHGSLSPDA